MPITEMAFPIWTATEIIIYIIKGAATSDTVRLKETHTCFLAFDMSSENKNGI